MRTISIACVLLSGCHDFWGWPGGQIDVGHGQVVQRPEDSGGCARAAQRGVHVSWVRVWSLRCQTEALDVTTSRFPTQAACEATLANDVGHVCDGCLEETGCCNRGGPYDDTPVPACAAGEELWRGVQADGDAGLGGAGGGAGEQDAAEAPPACDLIAEPAWQEHGLRGDECFTQDGHPGRFVCDGGDRVCRADPTRDLMAEAFSRVTPEQIQAAVAAAELEYTIGGPDFPIPQLDPIAIRVRQREVGMIYEMWARSVLEPAWGPLIRFHAHYIAPVTVVYRVGDGQEGNRNSAADQQVWQKLEGTSRLADYVLSLRTQQMVELKCPDIRNPRPWYEMGLFGVVLEVSAALQAMHYVAYLQTRNRDVIEPRTILRYRACQGWPLSWLMLLTAVGIVEDGGFTASEVDQVAQVFNWSHRTICGPRSVQQLVDFIAGAGEWHEVTAVECAECVNGGDNCLEGCVLRLALLLYDFCMD